MRRYFQMCMIGLAVGAGLFFALPEKAVWAGQGLTDAEIAKVRQAVLPKPGEDLFDQIPWQTDIWEARILAAKVGKPILLWEMDGHPLGCG